MSINMNPLMVRSKLTVQVNELNNVIAQIPSAVSSINAYDEDKTSSGEGADAHKSYLSEGHIPFLESFKNGLDVFVQANETHIQAINAQLSPHSHYDQGIISDTITWLEESISRLDYMVNTQQQYIFADTLQERVRMRMDWKDRQTRLESYLSYTNAVYDSAETALQIANERLMRLEYACDNHTGTGSYILPTDEQLMVYYRYIEREITDVISNPEKWAQLSYERRQIIIDYISEKYRGDDVKEVPPSERNLLIYCYERNHLENTGVINSFLEPIISDGDHKEDVRNIKYIAYASPEPYHSVFFKYLPELTLVSHHSHSLMKNEMSFGGLVFVELDSSIKKGKSDPRGSYATFFHEIGHGIDFAMSNPSIGVVDFITNPQQSAVGGVLANIGNIINPSLLRPFKTRLYSLADGVLSNIVDLLNPSISRPLNSLLFTDVENRIRREIEYVCGYPQPLSADHQADVQTILDSLMRGGTMDSTDPLYADRSDVQKAFGREADGQTVNQNGILYGPEKNGVSDAYWGITGKNISGSYGHPQNWDTDGAKDIIQKISMLPIPGIDALATVINRLPENIVYGDIILPGSEFFADSFSVNMTQYSESLDSMNTLLPDASSAFQDIMNNDGK